MHSEETPLVTEKETTVAPQILVDPDTPKASTSVLLQSDADDPVISVSTTFFPDAPIHAEPPDLILASLDSIFFYVHSQVLLSASANNFGGLMPGVINLGTIVNVPETSEVLNILLHVVHDMTASNFSPTFSVLERATFALPTYGLSPGIYVSPSRPLYALLLSWAAVEAISLYALAAHLQLEALAIAASSHLLSFDLSNITDDLALKIGPLYLKRLFFLHSQRLDTLKSLLLQTPRLHAATSTCNFEDQKQVTRNWALAAAGLVKDARPNTAGSEIESAFQSGIELPCELCRKAVQDRIRNIIVEWSLLKRTI